MKKKNIYIYIPKGPSVLEKRRVQLRIPLEPLYRGWQQPPKKAALPCQNPQAVETEFFKFFFRFVFFVSLLNLSILTLYYRFLKLIFDLFF